MTTTAPYGSWESPITVSMLSQAGMRLESLTGDDGTVYWSESRPTEAGRSVVVRWDPDSGPVDVAPSGFDSRTRVHEYGGGAWGVHRGVVYSSRFDDQRLYRLGSEPVPITPEPEIAAGDRYADFTFVDNDVICVRERHHSDREPTNELVRLPLDGSGVPHVIASGADFYAAPRVSPDGSRLAWIEWNHPNMPWDGAELHVASIGADGKLEPSVLVAGGTAESVIEPRWSPDRVLHFVTDRSGWWNLHRLGPDGVESIYEAEAEFGDPSWMFGYHGYGFLGDGRIVCRYSAAGFSHLAIIANGSFEPVHTRFTDLAPFVAVAEGRVWVIAGNAGEPPGVRGIDPASGDVETVRLAVEAEIEEAFISIPEPIEFPTEGDRTAHAFFYPPRNGGYAAPDGELPPLVVFTHGGPTGTTTSEFNLGRQFFTSRGFALVDVNYGGSTGYGREYRQRLEGRWGIVDLDDCVAAARHLAARGLVDPERMAIRGGSAGGYTTLAALAFRDTFAVGASYFGVADLAALSEHTHKFESRYLDGLIGPYPEAESVYRERSPVFHGDRLSCPIILLQGLDDRVVLPEQAEVMVEALDAKGIPHAYVAFEGEGHGFRQAANIERAAEAELYFYGKVFGFEPADDLEPVEIRHEEALIPS
jgi:dipeptidyl aminopeptidase/acylaminoacyl peptidase